MFLDLMIRQLAQSKFRYIINRLKVVLVEQKRTNKWLSEQMGKNISTISQWCTNERQPSLETFVEIAIVLDVEIKDLLNSTKL